MIFWTLLLAVAAVSNADGASRIVGGETTSIERFPSLVQVESRSVHSLLWSQTCAANILNSKHLLTVAHCFGGFLFSMNHRRIRTGTSYRGSGGRIYEIDRYISHPSYGRNDYDGDIAILTLKGYFSFNAGTQPIKTVPHGFVLFDHLPVTHAGWGVTRVGGGGSSSSQLRHIQVYSINLNVCMDRYKRWKRAPDVTRNMICAGVLDVSDRDACDGDDGGPMYWNGLLAGLVSWGRSCADATYPRVNTKISSYTNWIRANTAYPEH